MSCQRNAELEVARQRKVAAEGRGYAGLYANKGTVDDEDEEWERNRKEGSFDPDDDFMVRALSSSSAASLTV